MRKDGAQSIEVERAPLPQELVLQSSVLRNEPVSEYACVRGPSMFCCCDCCLVAYAYARLATRPVGWIDAIAGAYLCDFRAVAGARYRPRFFASCVFGCECRVVFRDLRIRSNRV